MGTEIVDSCRCAPIEGARVAAVRGRPFSALRAWLLLLLPLVTALLGCGGGKKVKPGPPFTYSYSDSSQIVPEVDSYRVLVLDELTLTVLGSPEMSGNVRVLPDGTITVPGVGSIYVLGLTLPEITDKVTESVATVVRYTQVSVGVADFGERRIYTMGEINSPGDHPYQNGLTALGAIAESGGFTNGAKQSSVIVLRRVGPDNALAFRLDLRDPLKGKNLQNDMRVRPYDIVYVPKTFIASVDVLMDQYFRQMTPPFSMYITGWNAFHIDKSRTALIQ
jgi:protein involved in polysaccharide export with SLBB domain